jgi:hypothetical protein
MRSVQQLRLRKNNKTKKQKIHKQVAGLGKRQDTWHMRSTDYFIVAPSSTAHFMATVEQQAENYYVVC